MVNGEFLGPVRPTDVEEVFRETGETRPAFQGPVPRGGDVETFRRTGRTVSRGGGRGRPQGPTRETLEAEQRRQAEIESQRQARIAEQQATQQRVQQQQRQVVVRREAERRRTVPSLITAGVVGFPGARLLIPEERRRVAEQVTRIRERPTRQQLIGVGGVPGRPLVTGGQVVGKLREGRLPSRVAAEIIDPITTPEGLAIVGTVAGVAPSLPAVVRIPAGTAITGFQAKTALTPGLPPERRIAAGIIGAAVGVGTLIEAAPFARGVVARVSPRFRAVRTQPEGFRAVGTGQERIGLIQPGAPARTGVTRGVKLPRTSPLRRGGFGVRPGEKAQFIGGPQRVATSQIGFFRTGRAIKLQREFFVTPQEPTLGIAQTRVSRLGLVEPLRFQRAQIGFGIPKGAQIGIERAAVVTRTGRAGTFRIGTGTELEAIKGAGAIISGVRKIGVTTIRGQAVNIFRFVSGRAPPTAPIVSAPTTAPIATVSGELVLGAGLATARRVTRVAPATTRLITTTPTPVTRPTPTRISPLVTPPRRITRRPTRVSPPITPPTTPTITPVITPTRITRTPTIPISPPITPLVPPISPPSRPRIEPSRIRRRAEPRFTVFVRRFGRFRPIARVRTPSQAFRIGSERVSRTLAATFKVEGPKLPGLPRGFRRRGELFIEKRQFRLSRTGEVKEIQAAKRRKKKTTKKKKRRKK